jgi:predicted DNA-binding protein
MTDLIPEFDNILDEFKSYCKELLKIKDKNEEIIPFVFNVPQSKVYEVIERLVALGKPIRLIILKARQEGISTLIEGFLFYRTTTRFNIKALIVGHTAKASTNLFEMTKRYYDYLPEPLKPSVKLNNEKKLSFDKLGSEINVETAEGRGDIGRSGTASILHLTELAFWADAKASLNAVLQSVSKTNPNSIVVMESTANGVGGEFYDAWQDAKDGKSDYIPIFLAWFDLPEYTLMFDSPDMRTLFRNSMSPDEIKIMQRFNLTLEQMHWRSNTIANECRGVKSLFSQEYPDTPEDAFVTTGRPVFDMDICRDNYEKYKNYEPEKFNLEYVYEKKTGKDGKVKDEIVGVRKIVDKYGYYTMLEEVQIEDNENYRFAVGTDVAEGLEQGDYSVMDVLDRKQNKSVIKFHGHIEPDLLAVEQHKLMLFLKKKAHFCTEVNNHGLTVVVHAYNLRVKQYYRQNFQKGYEVETMDLGFKTTGTTSGTGTKPMMIDRLVEAIREKVFIDEDFYFWKEAMTFVKNARGQTQAQGKDKDPATKCFDDRVIAKALAYVCNNWLPPYSVSKVVKYNYVEQNRVKDMTDF